MTEQRRNTDGLAVKLDLLHADVGDMKRVLEKLTDSINRLAIIEERQSTTTAAMERAFAALEKVETRISKLEASAYDNKQTGRWVRGAVWAAACAAVAFVAKKVGLL